MTAKPAALRVVEQLTVDGGRVTGDPAASNEMGDNVWIKAHVSQLNDTIGQLRSEKAELVVQLRKHQSRVVGLEASLEKAARLVNFSI